MQPDEERAPAAAGNLRRVAERMGIRETTAKQYIDRARVKYGQVGRHAASKAALLARALEDGLIRPDEIDDR